MSRKSADEIEAMLADLPRDARYESDLDAFDLFEGEVDEIPLSPEFRRHLIARVDSVLRVRRSILLLAAHATGGHLKRPHGESCEVCKERWPCVTVRRAAGPALNAFADCQAPHPDLATSPTHDGAAAHQEED